MNPITQYVRTPEWEVGLQGENEEKLAWFSISPPLPLFPQAQLAFSGGEEREEEEEALESFFPPLVAAGGGGGNYWQE